MERRAREELEDFMKRLKTEKTILDKQLEDRVNDLITRFHNTCAELDQARAQNRELEGRLALVSEAAVAAGAAAALANRGLPSSAAAAAAASNIRGGPERVLQRMEARGMQETELERKTRELQAKQQQLNEWHRKLEEEKLLTALSSPMGFHKGQPLAALVVFRACLQWRAFHQADRTSVFDHIIQVIDRQIERQEDDNDCLAYWLTNTVTLLHLLERNITPASGKTQVAAARRVIMGGLFAGQPDAGEASINGGGVGGCRLIEAKYPTLLFRQRLDGFVQKIFFMMRDNIKKNITAMLGQCIQPPRSAHSNGTSASLARRSSTSASLAQRPSAAADTPAASPQNKAWSDILAVFEGMLTKLKDNHVPKPLVQAMFKQLFSFVNVELFNGLLLRRECCSLSNGECIWTGLAQVETWIMEHGTEWLGESWDELKFIRQATAFLVTGDKHNKTMDDFMRDLCPALSIRQLYRISTIFSDDKCKTDTVNDQALGRIRGLAKVDSSSVSVSSVSFLLDDDSTLPFVSKDILAQMDDKDLYAALPLPEPPKAGGSAESFLKALCFGD